MLIIKPHIFNRFPEITFGFSTKIGLGRKAPYFFNMSYSVGDETEKVNENRKQFFLQLGLNADEIAYQMQVHNDKITNVNNCGNCGESDAMITTKQNLGLAISTADCCAIFIYDPVQKLIAGVHSGWRGTSKKILQKILNELKTNFNSEPQNLVCYLSPSISQVNYRVGEEVAEKFDSKYLNKSENGIYLNISQANYDILLDNGVKKCNVQSSKLCTYEYSEVLHSYRRNGKLSGRALGIIAMKDNK